MNPENQVTSQQRRPDWAALVIAAVLVAMAAVIFFDVARLNETTGYSLGPATVPHWIAYVLVGLGVWTVFAAFRRDFPERERQEFGPVVWVVAGLVAQMVLIRPLGFSIATGALFGLAAAGFGARRIWISIPVGIVICLGIYWLFAVVLQLSLPAGPLEHLIH